MEEAPELLELVYASAATGEVRKRDLAQILNSSRRNNAELGVSGMLLFVEGSFLQVLEGEPDVVEALFEKIGSDPRHGRSVVLRRAAIAKRRFEGWRMGFVDMSIKNLAKVPGFSNFLRDGRLHLDHESDGAAVSQILSAFKQGRYRQTVEAA